MNSCPACQREFPQPPGGEIPDTCPHCSSRVLGPYCDLVWIGGGGMGDVYRAREPEMGNRTVAIKVPRTETDPQRAGRRFEREIAASARLQHENAVRAYHRGTQRGRPYLVMELVSGRKLSDVVWQEHPLAPRRVGRIALGVARGLEHAARQGVVNRDVKPENVFLADPHQTPKVLDYGLALIADAEEQVTRSGSLLGTPKYIAPEQFRDPHSVTIAADVYSLGCTIYYCLVGRPPFGGGDLDETFSQHDRAARPSVRDVRGDVPAELDELIRRMMASRQQDRPSPGEVIETLGRLLPKLSDQRPAMAEKPELPRIDVECPQCRTQYHLAPDSAGRRMRCPNRLCGGVFTVPLSAELDGRPEAESSQDGPPQATVDFPEVLDAELADQPQPQPQQQPAGPSLPETVVAEPLRAEDESAARPQIPTLPVDAIVTETYCDVGQTPGGDRGELRRDAVESPVRKRPPPGQRIRRIKRWAAAAMFLLCAASAVIAWKFLPPDFWGPDPDARWTELTDYIAEHKWQRALRHLDEFREEFPGDPRIGQVPFFVDLCRAGPDVYSPTGNPRQGLARVVQIFQDHRDNPAYKQYYIDLYQVLDRLIERFTGLANSGADLEMVGLAREAYQWLKTVTLQSEEDWVKQRTAELGSKIATAEHNVRLALARRRAEGLLQQAIDDPRADPDETYAQVGRIFDQHPVLAGDVELRSRQEQAYAAESARPQFVPDPVDAGPAEAGPAPPPPGRVRGRGNRVVVVWGDGPNHATVFNEAAAGLPPQRPDRPVLALARGVLHAFEAHSGRLLWVRRLGIDSHRLPGRIDPSDTSPAAVVALSTEQNRVLALEEQTGKLRWQYPHQGGDPGARSAIVATLTIVDRRGGTHRPDDAPLRPVGLLPTAEGEIHVLELSRGRRLGRYVTGEPMTLGGTYDPATGLVFFPAEAKRIYALDPAAVFDPQLPACRSVLFTDHGSGALRSRPVVVGRYLIVSEASELQHTRLRAYLIGSSGFRRPTMGPQKELTLAGWSWFEPHCTPDRITMVTDEGRLGVFGLNLDNPSEALYRIVADWDTGRNTPFRPLAVDAQEHLLWIISGGTLQKLSVDVVHERVNRLWPPTGTRPPLSGIPIHAAQTDRFAQRYFLATITGDGRAYHFTAVEADDGARLWQRQLGLTPLGDPVPIGDGVLFVDQTGRTLAIRPGVKPLAGGAALHGTSDGPSDQPSDVPIDAAVADGGQLIRLDDPRGPPGPIHLVAPVDGGRSLAVSRLQLDPAESRPPQSTGNVTLEDRLHGRPCICGRFLVVPCADGRLYRVPLPGTAQEDVDQKAFFWSQRRPGPNRAEVYGLTETAVLLIDGRQRIRRLQLSQQKHLLQWRQVGQPFYLRWPLLGRPLLRGEYAYLFDSRGTLHRIDVDNPGEKSTRRQWPLGVEVVGGPFVRGGRILAVDRQRRLVCLADDSAADAVADDSMPLWVADGFRGRICGAPLLSGDTLLVADNSRRITGIRLADGKMVWKTGLPVGVGPAAAPAPYAHGTMLMALGDGTLLQLPIPKQRLAEARK